MAMFSEILKQMLKRDRERVGGMRVRRAALAWVRIR
jgi:hypothetical protein